MLPYRLLALDLDGTLLNSRKELSPANRAALERAAAAGMLIVPCTGRLYDALPRALTELPFLRYAITVNGAQVYDGLEGRSLYASRIAPETALALMEYMDSLPVIYDCYLDGAAYMSAGMKARIDDYAPDPHIGQMLHQLRRPVAELKDFVRSRNRPVEKLQMFFRDIPLRDRVLQALPGRFPELLATSALANNIELNSLGASKGQALRALAGCLGIAMEQTMGFGDGLNDRSLLEAAGCGVAMGNALPQLKQVADFVTADCDEDGVARAIEALCFPEDR